MEKSSFGASCMKIAHEHHVLWTVSPFVRIVAPYRAPLERGASYRQLHSLCSLAGGYDCCALRVGMAEASRMRTVIRGRCPRATARTPPPHHRLQAGPLARVRRRGRHRHTTPSHDNSRALPACDGEDAAATPPSASETPSGTTARRRDAERDLLPDGEDAVVTIS